MKQIPNIFTLLNLACGCIAIVLILQNGIIATSGDYGVQLVDMPERIWLASLFIGIAAVVDFFDGFVARLLKASSAMGKELDSLADVVSFGVAPGMIMYQFLRMSYAGQDNGVNISILYLLPAVLIPCCGAYRLARFNIDDSQQYGFKGVPIPAAGLLIASFPLILWYSHSQLVNTLLSNAWVLYAIIFIVSYLMVSTLPMMGLKFKDYSWQNNKSKYLLVILTIVSIPFLKWLSVPVIFVVYVLMSLITLSISKK